jgi:hypothetical protein
MSTKAQDVSWHKLDVASSSGKRSVVLASQVERDELCYRHEAIGRLKSWERNQWGRMIVGRRGQPTRFLLSPAAIKALKAGSTSPNAEKSAEDNKVSPQVAQRDSESYSGGTRLHTHLFQLRADLQIEINLPADVTDREATRLARFVEALPL